MSRLKAALVMMAVCVAGPAAAQISGTPFEVSGQGGMFFYDGRARVHDGPAWAGSFGMRFQSWLVLEGQAVFGPSHADTFPEQNHNFVYYGADLRMNLRSAERRVVPYMVLGLGVGSSHTGGHPPEKLERGAGSLGLGVLLNVINQRTFVRLQARDVWFRERDALEFSNHFAVTGGLHWLWGGKPRDQDLDGVRDGLDKCPDTPIGAKVDANGCPIDSDQDKVFDGLDECANTPQGCTVDAKGCPSDADGDGVCDGLDQCADTPKGALIDAKGCPNDDDGDGVANGLDQCPGTPAGAAVDARGCPKDGDGDGVADGLDKCPDTAPGLKVDKDGCPIELIERETELMDTGMIRLQNVNFETAKWDILPESQPILDVVGQVLGRWPELRIEIGGHADWRGSDAYNLRLSQKRVDAVLSYLLQKFPNLKREQFTAKGYGESRPIATNKTVEGMARNRRVEFVVQNKDVLKREVERRRLLKSSETTPAPAPVTAPLDTIPMTPAPVDTTQR